MGQVTTLLSFILYTLYDRYPYRDLYVNLGISVFAGGSPGPGGKLSINLTDAYIYIPTNDNPYGLFSFAPNSLDESVAEDTKPGYEYEATVNLTVLRKRGKDRDVGVSKDIIGCIVTKHTDSY